MHKQGHTLLKISKYMKAKSVKICIFTKYFLSSDFGFMWFGQQCPHWFDQKEFSMKLQAQCWAPWELHCNHIFLENGSY